MPDLRAVKSTANHDGPPYKSDFDDGLLKSNYIHPNLNLLIPKMDNQMELGFFRVHATVNHLKGGLRESITFHRVAQTGPL
jgi:hypothetical protein